MRPSKLLLWWSLAALVAAMVCVVVPTIPTDLALVPAGVLVSAFVLDWVVSIKTRSFNVTFEPPKEIFAGEAEKLSLLLEGKAASKEQLHIEGKLSLDEGIKAPEMFSFVSSRHGLLAEIPIKGSLRGVWKIRSLWLRWSSRFGLIEFVPRHAIEASVAVVPNIRPIRSGEIDLKLRSSLFGAKETIWRGEGSEFHQMTEYVAGMDPRSIDWKHSARHQKMLAKEMRAERNHQIIMAVDNGQLMREEIKGLPKIDHMINSALALTWAGLQSGDLVGFFGFDARPQLYAPPSPGQKTFARLRSQMADMAYRSVATNHTLALSHLHQRLQKRSLIVVFSDFADPLSAELLLDHMTILQRRHVVVFVSLRDPVLETIVDGKTSSMESVAQSVSAGHMLQERRSVLDQMAAMGIYVIESYPGELTPRVLSTYLDIKAREVI